MSQPTPRRALGAAIVVGTLVGLQGQINGDLAGAVHSALETAMLSFIVGLALLAFALPTSRVGFARLRRARPRPQRPASWDPLDIVWPEPGTSLHPGTVVGASMTVFGVWLSGRVVEPRRSREAEAAT